MINPDEAPEGYRAVEPELFGACKGCELAEELTGIYCVYSCTFKQRQDGQDVIFKEIEKDG